MKLNNLLLLLLLLGLPACRGEGDTVQQIDQVLKIYVKNATGKDLLKKDSPEAYYSVELKDLGALRDRVSLSVTQKTDTDLVDYKEYIAGAIRTLQTGGNEMIKIYKSDIAVQFKTTASAEIQEDVMRIYYEWTPERFQIKSIIYNNVPIFQKIDGQPNSITIVK